jgi:hypothetical protein
MPRTTLTPETVPAEVHDFWVRYQEGGTSKFVVEGWTFTLIQRGRGYDLQVRRRDGFADAWLGNFQEVTDLALWQLIWAFLAGVELGTHQ